MRVVDAGDAVFVCVPGHHDPDGTVRVIAEQLGYPPGLHVVPKHARPSERSDFVGGLEVGAGIDAGTFGPCPVSLLMGDRPVTFTRHGQDPLVDPTPWSGRRRRAWLGH